MREDPEMRSAIDHRVRARIMMQQFFVLRCTSSREADRIDAKRAMLIVAKSDNRTG